MNANYIFEQSVLLSVFGILYFLIYRKSGHHKLNRGVLLSAILLSILVPLFSFNIFPYEVVVNKSSSTHLLVEQVSQEIAGPIKNSEVNTLLIIYFIGVILSLAHFFYQIFKISWTIRHAVFKSVNGCHVAISQQQASFSFFNYIFLERQDEVLMEHEFSHFKLKHSIDRIFMALVQIVFWFNPLFLLYRYWIIENHELAADERAIRKLGLQKHKYGQYLLDYNLNMAPISSINNQFSSLTKIRITMLKELEKHKKGTYLLILFIAFGLGCAFTFEDYPVYPAENEENFQDTIPPEAYYLDTTIIFDPQTYEETVIVTKKLKSESENQSANLKPDVWYTSIDTMVIFDSKTYKESMIIEKSTYPAVISSMKSINGDELDKLKNELGIKQTISLEIFPVQKKQTLYFDKNHEGFIGQLLDSEGALVKEFNIPKNQSFYELNFDNELDPGEYSINRSDGGDTIKLTIKK